MKILKKFFIFEVIFLIPIEVITPKIVETNATNSENHIDKIVDENKLLFVKSCLYQPNENEKGNVPNLDSLKELTITIRIGKNRKAIII